MSNNKDRDDNNGILYFLGMPITILIVLIIFSSRNNEVSEPSEPTVITRFVESSLQWFTANLEQILRVGGSIVSVVVIFGLAIWSLRRMLRP